jgi:hypothetical protein
MIQATARVLRNVIEIQIGERQVMAKPEGAEGGISKKIAALFATVYHLDVGIEEEVESATVAYHPKKDEIVIMVGEGRWRTESAVFRPVSFSFRGETYHIYEKLTGRFAVVRGEEEIVGRGELGFRTLTLSDYPPELERFFALLALGYLIRALFWAA